MQITAEEIGHEFEGHAPTANVSDYAIEDWITLLVFWLMAGCVFLQFFTRYVLNNSCPEGLDLVGARGAHGRVLAGRRAGSG